MRLAFVLLVSFFIGIDVMVSVFESVGIGQEYFDLIFEDIVFAEEFPWVEKV